MITYLLTHYFLENIIVRCMVVRYRLYTILFNVALIEIQHVLKPVGVLCFEIDCFPRVVYDIKQVPCLISQWFPFKYDFVPVIE